VVLPARKAARIRDIEEEEEEEEVSGKKLENSVFQRAGHLMLKDEFI
jgi:hypothetical protein